MTTDPGPHQPALPGLGPTRRPRRQAGPVEIAADLPVARVALDLAPPHLDRPFDYAVPAAMADDARPGVRVKARFAGRDVDGYVLARLADSDHAGALAPLRRVVSGEAVLAPEVADLARAVADHYAGTLSDVLRLAVPPRHARAEASMPTDTCPAPAAPPDGAVWAPYRGGEAFLAHLARGNSPRAVWTALPGVTGGLTHAARALAAAAAATALSGRGTLVVVPDARDVAHLTAALAAAGMAHWRDGGPVAVLTAETGPAARYREFLAVLHGRASVVVGTRAAAYAPLANPGLYVCWNDGEDTHAEPRAPHPHSREVLALRAEQTGAAFLLGSLARTVQAQVLIEADWAKELVAPRAAVRAAAPRVRALTTLETAADGPAATARIPSPAWRVVRDALAAGPVLVHVPRSGYLPVVACSRCRTPARCPHCHGPLALAAAGAIPTCTWCAKPAGTWTCPECHAHTLRSVRVGSLRTAEELGRGFPHTTVRVSGSATGVLDTVPADPALVVATPGAEPLAPDGYAAALLLDAAAATGGTHLTAAQDALARWLAAASLVRPGAPVLLVGDGAPAPTGALVRWDAPGHAARELAERRDLDLPPAVRVAALTGDRAAVEAVAARIELATPDTVLGPVELPDHTHRLIVRVPTTSGRTLATQLAASLAVRSARKEPGTVRTRLDPKDLL